MVCNGTIGMLLYRFYPKRRRLNIYEPKTDKVWEESVLNNFKSISVC